MTLHKNSQLTFDKGAKAIQWGKDHHFNNWCWYNSTFKYKKMNLIPATKFTQSGLKTLIPTSKILNKKNIENLQNLVPLFARTTKRNTTDWVVRMTEIYFLRSGVREQVAGWEFPGASFLGWQMAGCLLTVPSCCSVLCVHGSQVSLPLLLRTVVMLN